MKRPLPLLALIAALSAGAANAQTPQERVVDQLVSQGYNEIRISRTLLGRVRIKAKGDSGRREIVIDPRNGDILRDTLYILDDDDGPGLLGGTNSSGSGSSGQGETEDDNDDEDGNDDEPDEDDDDEDDGPDDNGGGDGDDSDSGDDDESDDDSS